jgi:hypothetical protein
MGFCWFFFCFSHNSISFYLKKVKNVKCLKVTFYRGFEPTHSQESILLNLNTVFGNEPEPNPKMLEPEPNQRTRVLLGSK